ncbi:MAG: outer membrane protein [bacterium P3]|nr:MAG: outer membrane protein [bacterium P3]KWW41026.1 MAG: outer membrane protein [bacterium F083]
MKQAPRFLFAAAVLLIAIATGTAAMAQKYACVNSEHVLKSLPDYVQAQQRLERYVAEWQQEIEAKYSEYETLQSEYRQKSYLLPDNLKKHHEEQISAKHQEIVALQQQRFGVGGDMDKKRAELLKPVQDRVYAAIERVANEKNYAFVFDRSGTSTVLYANVKYDITAQVLDALGYTGGSADSADAVDSDKKSKAKAANAPLRDSRRGPGIKTK